MASNIVRGVISRATHVSKLPSPRTLLRSRVSCLATTIDTEAKDLPGQKACTGDSRQTDGSQRTTELSDVQKLNEDIKALNEQLTNTQDKYLRSLAEIENVRQRLKKQIDEAKLFGIQNFCRDILEVADVLNKAHESIPADAVKTGGDNFKNLFEGLKLTEAQLQGVFSRHGLAKIYPSTGDIFDPHCHEALFEVPTTEQSCGTIAVLQKVGYKLNNRTIRPAQVGVFKATE